MTPYLTDLLTQLDPATRVKLTRTPATVATPRGSLTDRQRAALAFWSTHLVQYAHDGEVTTASDLLTRVRRGSDGFPPDCFVIPHEQHGFWLVHPDPDRRNYYPDLDTARDAAWSGLNEREARHAA